jgi:hypothetical protein
MRMIRRIFLIAAAICLFPYGAAAQAAGFYTAEREARNSNAVPCPSRSPIPAQTGDGAAESCRILT